MQVVCLVFHAKVDCLRPSVLNTQANLRSHLLIVGLGRPGHSPIGVSLSLASLQNRHCIGLDCVACDRFHKKAVLGSGCLCALPRKCGRKGLLGRCVFEVIVATS